MPALLYNLELTEDELLHLWIRLSMLALSEKGLEREDLSLLSKIEELMEVHNGKV